MARDVLSILPVDAEPVNATALWQSRWSSRSPVLPHSSCTAPSGKICASIIARNTASVRYDVIVAGLTIAGTPASNVGASFSNMPHTGKLKALMCTATPSSGTQMWRPTNVPPFDKGSTGPSI